MVEFNLLPTILGGAIFGTAAAALLLFSGRIAGFSGIIGGIVTRGSDWRWRLALILGVLLAAAIGLSIDPTVASTPTQRSLPIVALAGAFVGVGTRMANGCTSGHGVCGFGRRSPRSIVATFVFCGAGFLTAFVFSAITTGAV